MPVRHRHGGKATAGPTPAAAASSVRDTFPEFPTHWFVEEPDGWESAKVYPHHLWGWRSDLDMAARLGDVETVRTIAETRPRREVQDFLEMRMLLTAVAEQGHLVMCAVLIDELGCFVDGVRDMRNRPDWHQVQAVSGNSGNGLGLTPLFRAVIVGHSRVVSLLIKRGANPNHAAENGGGTALHFAIAQRHVRCVAALLGCGKTNLSAKGPDGRTPRQLAEALVEGTSAPTCVPASGEVDPAQRKSAPSGKPGCGDTQNREGAQKIADMRASVIAALLRGEAIRGVGGRDACIKCGSEAQPLMCNCGLVHYCGDRCQESHWDIHGEEHEEMMRRDERFTHLACGDEGADFVVPGLERNQGAPVGAGAPHRAAFLDFLRGIFQVSHRVLCLLCRPCAGMRAPQSAPEHSFADTHNLLYPQLGRWWHLEKLRSYQCVVRTTSWLFPAAASDTLSL